MNRPAIMRSRQKLADGKSVFGLWITLDAPSITEMAVAVGLDWVVIDAEHGHLDWKDITAHLRAAARSGAATAQTAKGAEDGAFGPMPPRKASTAEFTPSVSVIDTKSEPLVRSSRRTSTSVALLAPAAGVTPAEVAVCHAPQVSKPLAVVSRRRPAATASAPVRRAQNARRRTEIPDFSPRLQNLFS